MQKNRKGENKMEFNVSMEKNYYCVRAIVKEKELKQIPILLWQCEGYRGKVKIDRSGRETIMEFNFPYIDNLTHFLEYVQENREGRHTIPVKLRAIMFLIVKCEEAVRFPLMSSWKSEDEELEDYLCDYMCTAQDDFYEFCQKIKYKVNEDPEVNNTMIRSVVEKVRQAHAEHHYTLKVTGLNKGTLNTLIEYLYGREIEDINFERE